MPKEDRKAEASLLSRKEPAEVVLADGQIYTIKPVTTRKLIEMEAYFDAGLGEILMRYGQKPVTVLRSLLFLLLKDDHPDLTEDAVADLVDPGKILELAPVVLGRVNIFKVEESNAGSAD